VQAPSNPRGRPGWPLRRTLRQATAAGAVFGLLLTGPVAIAATPESPAAVQLHAPKPTSAGISPEAPDPHPPPGGLAPDGSVPGGAALAARGLIVPRDASKLPKNLTARAWVLADLESGEILAARDPHGRYQPASILKVLTAITVLPNLPGKKIVTVSKAAASAEGSAVGLLAGARYTVDDLFAALMLVSGNDAAAALAEANGGVAKTVAQMNATAGALGAYDTVVQTPSGLDGWQQLTSAYDLALVLRKAVDDPRFVRYDRLASATYPAKSSKYGKVGSYQFDNQSLNFLRSVPGALVAKTGYTDAALHTYLCAAERNGKRLGIVFLRNQRAPLDQDQQAAALLKWGFALKAGTAPIGTLAGPIRPGSGASGSGAPPSNPVQNPVMNGVPSNALLAAPDRPVTGGQPTSVQAAGVIAGALALGVGGVAALRRRRRRSPRQY
jgi:D-alanyl-D-alanine carboxypeptidase (penicillin-binding protein 5/6)